MTNKNKLINDFIDLEPNDQLLVANEIVNELQYNEMTFDEDEYYVKKSKLVRKLFSSFMDNMDRFDEFQKLVDVFTKYECLSPKSKEKIIDEVLEVLLKYLALEEYTNIENICLMEGHSFGKWKNIKWTKYIDKVIDDQIIHDYPVEHEIWERTCSRCGYIYKVSSVPQELIEEREEKKKKHVL